MSISPTPAEGHDGLRRMQVVLSAAIAAVGSRYIIHPGDLAWWIHHVDPRKSGDSYWLWEDRGFVALEADENRFNAFTIPGEHIEPLIEWGQARLGGRASVEYVSSADTELEGLLEGSGYRVEPDEMTLFLRDLEGAPLSHTRLPAGWEMRPLLGEIEADARRRASHGAFQSRMDPDAHLDRYLRLMRSPVYDRERDLVVVSPQGRVASFLVWWPDPSGIAQLEPVGTDPEFQRQGFGKALMEYAFARMAAAGMSRVRVVTDDYRKDAMAFYPAAGFSPSVKLRSWKPA